MAKKQLVDISALSDEERDKILEAIQTKEEDAEKAEIKEIKDKLKTYTDVVKEVQKLLNTQLKDTVLKEKNWDIYKLMKVLALLKGYKPATKKDEELSPTQYRNLIRKIEKGITEPRKKKPAE